HLPSHRDLHSFPTRRSSDLGKKRLVARVPADLTLQDVLPDGRVLLARDNWRRGLIVRAPSDALERDFTWLDWSYPVTLSADGKTDRKSTRLNSSHVSISYAV